MQDSIIEVMDLQELSVFGVTRNVTTYEWLTDYVSRNGITFDMLYNSDEVNAAYGIFFEPTYVLIDKEGQIRFRAADYFSYRIGELKQKISALLNE